MTDKSKVLILILIIFVLVSFVFGIHNHNHTTMEKCKEHGGVLMQKFPIRDTKLFCIKENLNEFK